MVIFTVTVVIMIMISATIFVSVRQTQRRQKPDRWMYLVPFLMSLSLILVLSEIPVGDDMILRLPSDLIFSVSLMMTLVSSVWEDEDSLWLAVCVSVIHFALIIYHLLIFLGVFPFLSMRCFVILSGIGAVFIAVQFLYAIHMRIRQVRLVIKHGNVWSSLCVLVDFVYILFVVIYAFVLVCGFLCGFVPEVLWTLITLLLALEYGALAMRLANDSVFVLRLRHERRIVESMKLTQVEVSHNSSKAEGMYRNIYERVVQLFENDRMYLNSELTINDIVKVVYTNKLYISRAISQFTGRNFCQFVNYYRVIHSIQLFRENPDLKVAELANQSGFNSSVSFSMAFRLYMSESPSDWCRKERYKAARKKK